MADKLKPYDPNKGFISFKLDPDAIIEGLGNLIPYRNTIGMIDSEAPWSEVGETVLNETPLLGSILMGEPLDAIKEAFLFGTPVPAPLAKKQLSKFKPGAEIKTHGSDGIIVKEKPTSRTAKHYSLDDVYGLTFDYSEPLKSTWNRKKYLSKPTYNVTDIEKAIDATNAAFDKVPTLEGKNPIEIANRDIGEPLPYGAGLQKFNSTSLPKYRDRYNGLGQRIEAVNHMNKAQQTAANAKLRPGEKVGFLMPAGDIRIFDAKETKFRQPGSGTYNNIRPGQSYRKLPPKGITDLDVKQLKDDILERNERWDFGTGPYDDYIVPYRNMNQYYNDYKANFNAYQDAINGPFLEDVIPNLQRDKIF